MAVTVELFRAARPHAAKLLETVDRLKPFPLQEVKNPSFQEAAEHSASHRWQQALNHHHTLFIHFETAEMKARSSIEVVQDSINMGRFGRALDFLKDVPRLALEIPDERLKNYYLARVFEKRAWIDGCEGDPAHEINMLHEARQIIEDVEVGDRTEDENSLYSTTTHFLGRAYYSLAARGINTGLQANSAMSYFEEDLRRYHHLREQDKPNPSGEFYNHIWIGRCYLLVGNIKEARRKVIESAAFVEERRRGNRINGAGLEAHKLLFLGQINLADKDLTAAESNFYEALGIRQSYAQYAKGAADAWLGLTYVSWEKRNYLEAAERFLQAVRVDKNAVLKAALGG